MANQTYWAGIVQGRLNRRRILGVAGGAAVTVLAVACGSDGGSPAKNDRTTSSLITKPVDSTKQAKRGGVMLFSRNSEVDTSDPYFTSKTQPGTAYTYSRLFRQKPGYLAPQPVEFIGDLSDSWEFSPDKLQLTIKLKTNAKWHDIPPVSGRSVDAQDIAFSWQRFTKLAVNRSLLANSISPSAPILSITATDNRTVVLKLAQPTAALLPLLSGTISGYFWMLPREAEDKYDVRRTAIGSGQWMVKEYVPAVHLIFKRHEGWYDTDRLYFDEVQQPIVPEYAAAISQFKTGNIYKFAVQSEDILQTKKDVPALNLYALDPPGSANIAFFGWNPAYGASTPFRDQRLRQALSLSQDRDLWIDTFFNVDKFQAAGLPVTTAWNTAITTDWAGWWLDPKGKDFGANARYFQFSPDEAKKLVAAAGLNNGQEIKAQYITTGEYGADFNKQVETVMNFGRNVGLNLKAMPVGFNTDWRPKFADSLGDFEGVAFRSANVNVPDGAESAYGMYHYKGGGYYTGFFSPDSSFQKGDPRLNDLLDKTRTEFDTSKRVALIQDLQRIDAEAQYVLRFPGSASSFSLSWPILKNDQVFIGDLAHVGLWLDQTQAPGHAS